MEVILIYRPYNPLPKKFDKVAICSAPRYVDVKIITSELNRFGHKLMIRYQKGPFKTSLIGWFSN